MQEYKQENTKLVESLHKLRKEYYQSINQNEALKSNTEQINSKLEIKELQLKNLVDEKDVYKKQVG